MKTIETPQHHAEHTPAPSVGETAHAAAGIPQQATPVPEPAPDPAPRRSKKPLLAVLSTASLIVVGVAAFWKRAVLQELTPYFPVILPSMIAAFQICFKDWNNYKPPAIRWFLLLAVFLFCSWGVIYQNEQIRDKAVAVARMEAAQKAQQNNTEIFTKSFSALSTELGDLKTKVTSEALQNKIVGLQSRLDKAINPPQARLVFSFDPLRTIRIDATHTRSEPVTEKSLPLAADGSLHVDFTVFNVTNVDAIDGFLNLQICDVCKFAKEPAGFTKLPGQNDQLRHMEFARIHSHTFLSTHSADIITPPGVRDVALAMHFRCNTCVRETELSRIKVHLVPAP